MKNRLFIPSYMRQRGWLFIKHNAAALIAFVFCIVMGVAAGINTTGMLYSDEIREIMQEAPDVLAYSGIGTGMIIAILIEGIFAAIGILSAEYTLFMVLWPFALVCRGFVAGSALFVCMNALDGFTALIAVLVVALCFMFALPCMVFLYAPQAQKVVMRFCSLLITKDKKSIPLSYESKDYWAATVAILLIATMHSATLSLLIL